MVNGKVVVGAILVVIALWVFMVMPDYTARFVGGQFWESWDSIVDQRA